MNYLLSYHRSKLDLSAVGLNRREKESGYFCTPVLSTVIGWAGVDGIHFCTTKGFGELIFAVSPMNTPGSYVHPVAKNFEDFLRLLLACHDTAAIEQCWFMDREVFEQFLADNQPDEAAKACLNTIQKKYKLTPMEDPFGYIHDLQSGFDYSAIQYPPDYEEWVPVEPKAPEWKVVSNGQLIDDDPDAPGGKPVPVNVTFSWAGIEWFIPEIYPFDDSVSVYILGRIDPAKVPVFPEGTVVNEEDQERMNAENPMNIDTRFELFVNGLRLISCGSTGMNWMPIDNWGHEPKWVLEHYGMDMNYAWRVARANFRWPGNRRRELKDVSFTIKQDPISVSGTHFVTPLEGESVIVKHPQTGSEYTVYVDELAKEQLDAPMVNRGEMEYPSKYTRMSYRIWPDLDRKQFRIVDCSPNDQPRPREGYKRDPNVAVSTVGFGIIGGADGPTVMIMGQKNAPQTQAKNRFAVSSPHFEYPETIEWRIIFHEKPNLDFTISLI